MVNQVELDITCHVKYQVYNLPPLQVHLHRMSSSYVLFSLQEHTFETFLSFTPVPVMDMSKEKDWPARLGTLAQLCTNIPDAMTFCYRYA